MSQKPGYHGSILSTAQSWRSPLAVVALGLAASSAQAFVSGSTGADGALNPSANTEIVLPPSGVLNYTSINIPTGVTVTFKKNALNTPVVLLASGNVTIAGVVDVRGGTSPAVGTGNGGSLSDDGIAGSAGPGGFPGGRGGLAALSQPGSGAGGAGLGPGGGLGGIPVARDQGGCWDARYFAIAADGLGAGYASLGANPNNYSGCGFDNAQRGAIYGSAAIQPLIGGSGGGGGAGLQSFGGSGGGGGGGAILIAASGTLAVTGEINADGGQSGASGGTENPGRGGGGSGGAIRLVATIVSGNGKVYARGGCNAGNGCTSYSSQASEGRIRIEGETISFNGTSTPTRTTDIPGPIVTVDAPTIRISAIAGTAVPSTPTGSADVTFANAPTNPVKVDFSTTNIPPGNTLVLRVVPSAATPFQVLSPAISGTTANGTVSVSVNLPTGASTLQAIASFTVAVAMGDALSRFAFNERVERVELVASLGGQSMATLITVSGKRVEVPLDVLRYFGAVS